MLREKGGYIMIPNTGNILSMVDGSIYSDITKTIINDPAIIVDTDGVLLSYGNAEYVSQRYERMKNAYEKVNLLEEMDDKLFIKFDTFEGKLTNEEVCTLINYGMNAHMSSFYDMFSMSPTELKARLKQLHAYGY